MSSELHRKATERITPEERAATIKALEEISKEATKSLAVDEATKMLSLPMSKLPKAAAEYLKHLSASVGMCMEVCLTAYAYYNQAVWNMPCDDDLYLIPKTELQWFIDNKYIVELSCMVCNENFYGKEPQMCCSGRECGCMGMPTEPIVCSIECYDTLLPPPKNNNGIDEFLNKNTDNII